MPRPSPPQTFLTMLLAASVASCAPHKSDSSATPIHLSRPLQQSDIGHEVIVEGIAERAKIGPELIAGDTRHWIVGIPNWESSAHGHVVRVTGRVAERNDLPVFVQNKDDVFVDQGIPRPPGPDLKEARKRLVIECRETQILK